MLMGALGCTGACHRDPQTKAPRELGRAAAGDLLEDTRDRLSPPPQDEVGWKSSWCGGGLRVFQDTSKTALERKRMGNA